MQPESNTETLPTCPEKAPKGIPISAIIEYKAKGLTHEEIGRILGCSKSNITQRLNEFGYEIDCNKSFKDNRADVLSIYQHKLLNSLTEEKIKGMSGGSLITGAAILYDKERLERGQSTQNIMYADMSRSIKDLDKEIEALEEELGEVIDADK